MKIPILLTNHIAENNIFQSLFKGAEQKEVEHISTPLAGSDPAVVEASWTVLLLQVVG